MKASVDAILCIGCGLCTEVCPDVFIMVGDTAVAEADPCTPPAVAACRDAMSQCPVNAISITE